MGILSGIFKARDKPVTEQAKIKQPETEGHSVEQILERLDTMKKFM